jgi:predicted nuclease of predicted toxin-antitoxin system
MKFLADINIPQTIIIELTRLQHDILDSKGKLLMAPDTELIALAKKENRIILTRDKDFITLTQYPTYQVPTIVIRLKNQHPEEMLQHILELLEHQKEEILINALTIIKDDAAHSYPYT